jgi:hypothetical protein
MSAGPPPPKKPAIPTYREGAGIPASAWVLLIIVGLLFLAALIQAGWA